MYKAAITYCQTFFGLSHIWQCSRSCGCWSAEMSIPMISRVSSDCSQSGTSRHWHVWICTCSCQRRLDGTVSYWDLNTSNGFGRFCQLQWLLVDTKVFEVVVLCLLKPKPSEGSDAEPFSSCTFWEALIWKIERVMLFAEEHNVWAQTGEKFPRMQLYRSYCGKRDKLLLFPGPFSAAAPAPNSNIAKMKTILKRTKRVEGEDALIALSPQESLLYPPQSGSDFFFSRVGLSFIEPDSGMPPTHFKKTAPQEDMKAVGDFGDAALWLSGAFFTAWGHLGHQMIDSKIHWRAPAYLYLPSNKLTRHLHLRGEPAWAARSGAAVSYARLIPESCAHMLVKSSVSICRCFFFSFPPFSEGI